MLALPHQGQQSEPILPASKVLALALPRLGLDSGVSAFLEEVQGFSSRQYSLREGGEYMLVA